MHQEFGNIATERVIPVRVIHPVANAGIPYNATLQAALDEIARANEVYRSAGIQFYIHAWETHVMPTFSTLSDTTTWMWSQVKNELRLPFPGLSLTMWQDSNTASELLWMYRAVTFGGAKHELTWFIHPSAFSHWGGSPDTNRAAVWTWNPNPNLPLKAWVFAHEVGHALGLPHTFDESGEAGNPNPRARDPKTGMPRTAADVWDLVATPGTPYTFYSSRSAVEIAAGQGAPFKTIDRMGPGGSPDTCRVTDPATGHLECVVGTLTTCIAACSFPEVCKFNRCGLVYETGDPELKGLAFQRPGGNAVNVMSYDDASTYGMALSDSQIQQLQRSLRYEIPMLATNVAQLQPPAGVYPNADRADLGINDVHRAGPYPVDFDGDGKRDLAVWEPPTSFANPGRTLIRTSRSGYATTWLVDSGVLGDVPLPADYNGDGCTDIGFWRTNGLTGQDYQSTSAYFVYCPSTGAPNCPQPVCATSSPYAPSAQWGYRSDVPVGDARFSGTVGDVTVFRPSTGEFFWRKYVQGGGNGGYPPPTQSKPLGGARTSAYLVAGDYDDDGKQDPAVYNRDSATFEILRSGASYQKWTRTFSGSFIPMDSQHENLILSQEHRAAAFPLEGVGVYGVLSRPAAYFPYLGTWNVMWDVAGNGSVTSCAVGGVGTGGDWFPVAPNVDRDNDARSDMVLFSAPTFDTGAQLKLIKSNAGLCTGQVTLRSYPALKRPRIRAFWGGDMTGDGKAEIMFLDPEVMEFHWATSESDYAVLQKRQLGSLRSIPL